MNLDYTVLRRIWGFVAESDVEGGHMLEILRILRENAMLNPGRFHSIWQARGSINCKCHRIEFVKSDLEYGVLSEASPSNVSSQ